MIGIGIKRTRFTGKPLVLLAIGVLFAAQALAQQPQAYLPTDSTLTALIAEGQANSPSLKSVREQVSAANQRIPQAGSWPDPTLAFGAANLPVNTFSFNQEPMTAVWITLGQTVPLTHRFRASKAAASSLANVTSEHLVASELALGQQIASASWDFAYLRRSVDAVDSTLGLLDDLITITRTRYETGRGLQQDILRLQTERTKLDDRRALLEQQARSAERKVALLVGRGPEEATIHAPLLPDRFLPIDSLRTLQAVLEQNPKLAASKLTVKAMNEKERTVRAMRIPDLKLSAGYGIRQNASNGTQRPDYLTLTAGVSIPLFAGSKQNRAIDESRANQRAANQALKNEELNVRFELATLLDEDNRLAHQIDLYRQGVVPQASATLEAATSSYAVGKVDVEAMLSAETALINARLELYARLRDRAKTRAALAALAGSPELTGPGSTISE